jgi:hypothetical protein
MLVIAVLIQRVWLSEPENNESVELSFTVIVPVNETGHGR